MRRPRRTRHRALAGAFATFLLLLALFSAFIQGYGPGPNSRNYSVETRVNITNAKPEVLQVLFGPAITLTAGGTKTVECNVSVRDYNSDFGNVNATLFHISSTLSAADNNNTHYTNGSCAQTVVDGRYANYTCTVPVYYYALNGTWNCTATANDSKGTTGSRTNSTSVNALYAINVSAVIDYGNLSIEDTSENTTANITNFGNVPINVSVYGYGNQSNDGLSFVCEFGNISVGMQKYSVNDTALYAEKYNLTSSQTNMSGLRIEKQTDPAVPSFNTTYWQLYVPPNPFGLCNGTVVFQAELT